MLKKFNQYFKDLIYERTEEVGREILYNNKRFLELNSRIIEAQYALMENLPSQSQPLLYSYDEAETEQDGIIIETMYRQGLIDGIKLAKLLNRYGIIHKFFGKWLPS
jgi:hypothetical protein